MKWKKGWNYDRSRLFNADYLESIGASVIYQLSLSCTEQLTKAELKGSYCSVRIY